MANLGKKACYQVANANGALIKTLGTDYKAAFEWSKSHNGCGLRYGLYVVKCGKICIRGD